MWRDWLKYMALFWGGVLLALVVGLAGAAAVGGFVSLFSR